MKAFERCAGDGMKILEGRFVGVASEEIVWCWRS